MMYDNIFIHMKKKTMIFLLLLKSNNYMVYFNVVIWKLIVHVYLPTCMFTSPYPQGSVI